jgi:hypothetical protein
MSSAANAARYDALFASGARRCEVLSPARLAEVIIRTLGALGSVGCAAVVAQEFGDYPETAVARMRWAHAQVDRAFPAGVVVPGQDEQPGAAPLAA